VQEEVEDRGQLGKHFVVLVAEFVASALQVLEHAREVIEY